MKWVIFGSSFHPLFWAWLLALLLTGPVLINGRSYKGLSRPHPSPTEKNVKRRSGIESNPVKPGAFQEVKIDTSKLYNELLKAIKKDKTPRVHQRQRGAVKSNTKPSTSKRNEKHSPSIGYFMNLKQKAGKPSSNRQLIEYALPNQQQATSDPYWGSMGRPMETSPIISESVPISPTQAMFQSFNRVVSQNTPTIYLNPPSSGGSSFETHSQQQQTAKSVTSNKPKTSKKETQIFHLPTPKPFVAVHHAPITKTFEESKVSSSRETHEKGGSKRVYSLGDNVFTDVGCFLDKWIRSIPTLEGNHPLLMDSDYKTRSDPLQKCAEAALDKGLKLFAIQNGGQCFGGKTGESRYNVYGTSDQCKEDGLGGSWANEVYSYRDDGVPKETKQTKQTVDKPKEEITQQSFLSSEEDEDQRLTRDNQIIEDFQGKQHNKEPSFKGALKNIMSKVSENKKQSQAEKNIKIVKEIVKNLKAAKGEKEEPPPASVLTSKQTLDGEEFGRLGDAIARGHKPPCICPDKICSSKLDLAFVIDAGAGSEQGGKEKMAETMEFGRRVASAFKVTPEETRVGLITYATDAQVMMNFHRYADPDAIVEARDAVRVKPHTGKYTGQALDLAKEGLFDSGHRADALDVAVLLTDGPSSDDVTLPARKLRDMGVKIITVGIGPEVDRGQLNDIASDPDEEHVFTADYDSLATIIGRTQRAACVGGMLHEPVDKCKCNMYVKNDDKAEEELDKETAAFYNVYKTAVEASPRDANAVKYNTIYRPWNKRGNQFYQAFPRHYYNGYISAMGHRRDNVAMLHKMLPLLNPHPVMDASPLAELHHKVNSTSVNVPSQRRTGNINKKLDLYEAKLKENAMEMYEKMQKSDKENGGDKQKGGKENDGDKQKFDKENNGDKEESKKYDGDNKHPQRMSNTEDRNDKQEKNGESEKKLKEVKDHSNEQEKGEENSRQGNVGKNEGRFTQDEQQRESSQHFTQSPNDNEQQRVNSFSNDVSWKGKGKFSMGKWSNRLKGEKDEQEVADHEKLVSTGKNDEERNGEESKYTQQHQSKGEDHRYSHEVEGNREENRYPEESRFTQQHKHQADSKETDEAPSKNGASDGELSSKEKERLVFNYLKAHRHEFMKEDSQPSDHHGEGGGGEQSRPANMYQHEQDNNQYGKGQQMYDERMGSNSEGKLHRADEEQVLADAKPLRQAGGSHELPFEYVAQEEDKHHPTSESHGMENESESTQQRHKFHGEDEWIGNEPMTREEMTEEKYKNVFNNEDGTKNDRSKGGEQSKEGKKEDGKKNGELFTSEDKNKEKEKDNEEDDDKYKSFQGFKFRYGPTESFNKQQEDKPKKPKKGKKIYPDDDSAPQQSIKTKPSVGGANFGVSDFTGTGGGVGGNTGGIESDTPSKAGSHHEHEEGTAPSPFEPEEKLSYHPTKEPGYSRFKDDPNREEERQPLSHQQNGMDKNTSPYHSHEIQEKHGENKHQSVTNRESFASAPNESEAFSIGKHHHVKGFADSHATFRIHNKKVEDITSKKSSPNHRYGDDESVQEQLEGGDHNGPGENVDKIKVSDGEKDKEKKIKDNGNQIKYKSEENEEQKENEEKLFSSLKHSKDSNDEKVGQFIDGERHSGNEDEKFVHDKPTKSWKFNDKNSDNMVEYEDHKHWKNPKVGENEKSDSSEKYNERPKKFQDNEEAKQLHHLHEVRGNNDFDDNDETKSGRFSGGPTHHQRGEHEDFSEESNQQQNEHEINRFSKEESRESKQDSQDKDNERSEKFRGNRKNDKNDGSSSKEEHESSQYHQKENEEASQQSSFSSESKQGMTQHSKPQEEDVDVINDHAKKLKNKKQQENNKESFTFSHVGEDEMIGGHHSLSTNEMYQGDGNKLIEHSQSAETNKMKNTELKNSGNSNSITSFQRDRTPLKPSKNIDEKTTHENFNQFNLDNAKSSNTDGENVQHFGGSSNPYVHADEKADLVQKPSLLSTSGETFTKDSDPNFFIKKQDLKEGSVAKRDSSNNPPPPNMRLFEKQKQVTGRKRDESNGILTSDPFLEAVHFWPFETNKGILTSDLITGSDAILMGGAKITKKGAPNSPKGQQNYYNTQRASHMPPQQQQMPPHRKRSSSNHLQVRREEEEEDVEVFDSFLDTKMNGSYVIAGDFNGTCFSDPNLCKLNGMTIYTWLKIDAKELESTQNALGRDAYILSTGGQSKKSRGFAFLWFHGKFVMVISTETKQWKLEMPKDKIKHDEWVQLSFVWNTDTLTGYQDGTKIGSTKGVAAERPEVQFTIMTIGRPNNAVDARFMMKMEMAYLTLWDKALEEKELDKSYENIKQKIDKTRRRSILEKHSTIKQHALVNREMQN